MADLKLQVLLNMIDQATGPLKKVLGGSKAAAAELKRLRDTKRELDKQLANVEAFRKLREAMKANATQLQAVRQKSKQLQEAMSLNTGRAKEFQAELKKLTTEGNKITKSYSGQWEKLRAMRSEMQAAGFTTKQYVSREAALRDNLAKTTAAIDKQNAALKRSGALRGQFQRLQGVAANTSVAGYGAYATGRRVLEAANPIIGQARLYETSVAQMRAQGSSDADVSAAERFANTDTTHGSSVTEKLEVIKDANSIFRDMHEALQVSPDLLKTKFVFEGLMAKNGEGAGHGDETVNQLIDAISLSLAGQSLEGAARSRRKTQHFTVTPWLSATVMALLTLL